MLKLDELKGDVLLIAKDEPAFSYNWETEHKYIRPELQVLPYSFIDDYKKDYNLQFEIGTRLVPGCMLVKHPYLDNTYIDINNFEEKMYEYKFNQIKLIAKKLGAKKVSTQIIITDCMKRDFDAEVEASCKWVEVEGDYKKEMKDKLEKKFVSTDTTTGEMTPETYREAKEIAEKSGLSNDNDIIDLLEFRKPGSPIQNNTKHIGIELSKESNTSKEIAFSLKAMKELFSINAEIKETICKKSNVSLAVDIDF
ncbi:MAG: hypothetical protein IKP37_09880 [Paludibacteraceae bacterium]|nr:hypothetical protein [Paludibacteraceae bacterium]